MTLIDYNAIAIVPILLFLFYKRNGITILPASINLKTKFLNGIKIYKDKKTIEKIMYLINNYPPIWEFLGFI